MSVGPVLLVGIGLMGGSLAAALSAAGVPVLLHHHRPGPAEDAAARGWGTVIDTLEAARPARIAVVCTPVSAIPGWVRRIAAATNALITDVGSTKGGLVRALADVGDRYLGSHPMCGSHRTGIAAADPHLYRDRLVLITPDAHHAPSQADVIAGLWRSVGARVRPIDADEHDQVVAEASHLPHVLSATAAAGLSLAAAPVCAGGFRDTTRIAGGDTALWSDILLANRSRVMERIAWAEAHLASLRAAMDRYDRAGVDAWLAEGRAGRQRFEMASGRT